ncbi:MAG: hypothetical protein IPO72_18670 [Saprospiraceae bacterium]|nr:hypothetical protein [Candidatus Vicinibacter affinis]
MDWLLLISIVFGKAIWRVLFSATSSNLSANVSDSLMGMASKFNLCKIPVVE